MDHEGVEYKSQDEEALLAECCPFAPAGELWIVRWMGGGWYFGALASRRRAEVLARFGRRSKFKQCGGSKTVASPKLKGGVDISAQIPGIG